MKIQVFFNLQKVFLNYSLKYVIQKPSFHAILLYCILHLHYNSLAEFNIWECLLYEALSELFYVLLYEHIYYLFISSVDRH